mmetsp:Transcript_17211/g.38078  ORF Transcript_17211/g.38078 Transcript_17211/m.38078 type:complete len:200 (+) Transcript_17211:349-948(+)
MRPRLPISTSWRSLTKTPQPLFTLALTVLTLSPRMLCFTTWVPRHFRYRWSSTTRTRRRNRSSPPRANPSVPSRFCPRRGIPLSEDRPSTPASSITWPMTSTSSGTIGGPTAKSRTSDPTPAPWPSSASRPTRSSTSSAPTATSPSSSMPSTTIPATRAISTGRRLSRSVTTSSSGRPFPLVPRWNRPVLPLTTSMRSS